MFCECRARAPLGEKGYVVATGSGKASAGFDLVATCDRLIAGALDQLAAPWNDAIAQLNARHDAEFRAADDLRKTRTESALRSRQASHDAIAAEIGKHSRLVDEARHHFTGLADSLFRPALDAELRRLRSAGGAVSVGGSAGDASQVDSEFAELMRQPALLENGPQRVWGLLARYGIYLFGIVLTGVWFLANLGAAALSAAVVTIAWATLQAWGASGQAGSRVQAFIRVLAERQHWLTSVQRAAVDRTADDEVRRADDVHEQTLDQSDQAYRRELQGLVQRADEVIGLMGDGLAAVRRDAPWDTGSLGDAANWKGWKPADSRAGVVRMGELGVLLHQPRDGFDPLWKKSSVTQRLRVPLVWRVESGRSIYLRAADPTSRAACLGVMQNLVLRLLATTPPGKGLFTFVDPVGQGQNVAGFLALGDVGDVLISGKVFSEAKQIERRLAELIEHMEKVIQKYLRNDYSTITDYNRAAGEVAEAYHFVVVFDFPDSISDAAARHLERIVQNGARCGVFAFVLHDATRKAAHGVDEAAIRRHSIAFEVSRGVYRDGPVAGHQHADFAVLEMDGAPSDDHVRRVVQAVGERAKESLRVEVPFQKLLRLVGLDSLPVWKQSTIDGIKVPLGPGSARRPQFLELGSGMSVHALMVGRPGSGKSNLLHSVISTAACVYSPQEIQIYLIDFKQGVGFKPYTERAFPSIAVVALRSDREFGVSVLRKLDRMAAERAELFKSAGVDNYVDYRRVASGGPRRMPLPRVLLVVDEFQEYFVRDDALSDQATLLFDRIARQGRAFGIHVVLASQSLANYSLRRGTLDLFTVRIAMQCSEAESRSVLSDGNSAARLLSRPGEAIYNDKAGLLEGNAMFQAALFEDADREAIAGAIEAHLKANRSQGSGEHDTPSQIVFDGDEAAAIERSSWLASVVAVDRQRPSSAGLEFAIGEPVDINPSTTVVLPDGAGGNLLVFERNEADAVGVMAASLISLLCQLRPGDAQFSIVDMTAGSSSNQEASIAGIAAAFQGHRVELLDRGAFVGLLDSLNEAVKACVSEGRRLAQRHHVFVLGVHRIRELMQDGNARHSFLRDEPAVVSPARRFAAIAANGPEAGVHLFVWCDTIANFERIDGRELTRAFGVRLAGRMTSGDSQKVVDEDTASRIEKPHRMIKYDEAQLGRLEPFRPYALPTAAWTTRLAEWVRTLPR